MSVVFGRIQDALERAKIGDLLKDDGKAEEFAGLCQLFDTAWPIGESLLEKPKNGWQAATRELLRTSGRAILEFSHHQAVDHRGIEHIEENWKKIHKDEFARLLLEVFAGHALGTSYRALPLNILVVDNKPDEILQYQQLLPPHLGFAFWRRARWFLVDKEFPAFEDKLRTLKALGCRSASVGDLGARCWYPLGTPEGDDDGVSVSCGDIDLILQDQYLATGDGSNCPEGSRLAEHYIDVMPQALVFLATGTDIGELAALGQLNFVDRAIPKKKLAALPWYYYLAFLEVLGAMFWEAWLSADADVATPIQISSRWTLRRLLGSIRTWTKEPDVLWHGQTCAELVDHSQPHISDMWRMANEVVGARLPDTSDPFIGLNGLSVEERILLALGIWTHDVGHRGDDRHVDSMSIRDVHSSISEALLLSNRRAFGLEWLDELCPADCQCRTPPQDWLGKDDRRYVRSLMPEGESKLCLLRLTGIVSKHHQSSAPLSHDKVPGLIVGLKRLQDYSRVLRDTAAGPNSVHSVADWSDDNKDLSAAVRDILCLEDFEEASPEGIDLQKVTCLLRFLDAIHMHRCRAGSPVKIATHSDYLNKRRAYCEAERSDLLRVLRDSPQGSKAYLHAFDRYVALTAYQTQLIEHQEPHLWRQEMVERREVRVEQDAEGYALSIVLFLRSGHFGADGSYFTRNRDAWCKKLDGYLGRSGLQGASALGKALTRLSETPATVEYACWIMNFVEDVAGSELLGQEQSGKPFALFGVLPKKRTFFVVEVPECAPVRLSLEQAKELA